MATFVIVGGDARKAKGRFGGESKRSYDRSYERRHLKLTARQLLAAALEDIDSYESAKSRTPVSTPKVETREHRSRVAPAVAAASDVVVEKRHARPKGTLLTFPRAVYHNNRKVVTYPGGMRIFSASY